MRVSIIRHGMTRANEKRLYCGFTDLPLSEQGKQNLTALRKFVIYPEENRAAYITSGLLRTTETLQILYDRKPDFIMEEFKELNFGEFEMKSYDELKNIPEYQKWINGGNGAACPGGESRNDLEKRVKSGLDKLAYTQIDDAVIISHGGVISVIMETLFPGIKNFYEWQPDFGRGYTLDIFNTQKTTKWPDALISEI
ncbi:MAG TPA: histidine phosphatase family protein [Treponema sp.]|nr:histidine phosphatase family protein [Treponema sp.]